MKARRTGWCEVALIGAGLALSAAAPAPSPGHDPTREEAQEAVRRAEKAVHASGRGSGELEEIKAQLAKKTPMPPTEMGAYATAVEKLRAAPSEELFAFAAYQGQLPLENLGDNMQVGLSAARMASMTVHDSPVRLMALYQQELQGRSSLRSGKLGDRAGYVTFREADGFMRSLTLVSMGESTLVLASISDPSRVKPDAVSVPSSFPADVPMPAFQSNPVDLRSDQGEFTQHTRQGTTVESSPDALVSYFDKRMAEAGWRPEPARQKTEDKVRLLVFSQGARQCTMTVSPPPREGSGCALAVMCIQRRAP